MCGICFDNNKRKSRVPVESKVAVALRKRRRVEFSSHTTVARTTSTWTGCGGNDSTDTTTWYNRSDYTAFKQQAIETSKNERLRACCSILDNAVFTSSNVNNTETDQIGRFNIWTTQVEEARGLESVLNHKLAMARRLARVKCIKAVIMAQTIAKSGSDSAAKSISAEQLISLVSLRYTSQAKTFALLMGKADENAVKLDAIPKFFEIKLPKDDETASTFPAAEHIHKPTFLF